MANELDRMQHDQRISNLRMALQLAYVGPPDPAALAKLHAAIGEEFTKCDRLGCTTRPIAEVGKR